MTQEEMLSNMLKSVNETNEQFKDLRLYLETRDKEASEKEAQSPVEGEVDTKTLESISVSLEKLNTNMLYNNTASLALLLCLSLLVGVLVAKCFWRKM